MVSRVSRFVGLVVKDAQKYCMRDLISKIVCGEAIVSNMECSIDFFFFLVCIYWLCWVFVAMWAFLQLQCTGFSLPWLLLLLLSTGSGTHGLQWLQFQSSRAQTEQLWFSLLCSMRDLPGPGIKPVSAALAGGFLLLSHQGSLSIEI